MSRFTSGMLLVALAILGVACGLIAGGSGTTTALPTDRVTGDPPVSAAFEVRPEGTAPPDIAITALDVTVRSDLPVPATTECNGVWVEVRLRSGRVLRYPPCAMPAEIARLRDSAFRVGTAG